MTEAEQQTIEQINALYERIEGLWTKYHKAIRQYHEATEFGSVLRYPSEEAHKEALAVMNMRVYQAEQELLANTTQIVALSRKLDPTAFPLQ